MVLIGLLAAGLSQRVLGEESLGVPKPTGKHASQMRIDTNAMDQPITIGTVSFARGWTGLAPVQLEVEVEGRASGLSVMAGLESLSPHGSGAWFEVRVDGRRKLRTTMLRAGEAAVPLSVDVRGAKKLELIAHYAIGRRQSMSIVAWGDPKWTSQPPGEPGVPGDRRVFVDESVQEKLFFDTTIQGKPDRRPYYLSLPRPVEAMRANGERYPMLVFLHGIAEGGDDHRNLFIEAIPQYILQRPEYISRNPFIFVCPQAPWQVRFGQEDVRDYVVKLIEHLRDTLPVDADRIYLTGLSDGAIGTWAIAAHRADLFAAIVPVAGRAAEPEPTARALVKVPAWMVVGEYDDTQHRHAKQMHRAFKQAGGISHLIVVPGMHHVVWDQAYLDPALYDWLLSWKRGAVREPFTSPATGPALPQQQALAAALKEAQTLRESGDAIGAYGIYQQIALQDRSDQVSAKVAQLAMDAMQRDPDIAAKLKAAADETSASQMLANAGQYQQNGEHEMSRKLHQQIIDTWPLTDAARKAKEAMGEKR